VAERQELRHYFDSDEAEFVAVHGRRRVGKTYLVREFFEDRFAFSVTGTVEGSRAFHLETFDAALAAHGHPVASPSATWLEAFTRLDALLRDRPGTERQVVFIDELPWFDTPRSDFLAAFTYFWNNWASRDRRLLLVVCGSASAWIARHLFHSRGGLHNRVTGRLGLAPLTLLECEEFFSQKGIVLNRLQQVESYMVFGGIPFYLNLFRPGLSLDQNVDRLLFGPSALLADEYDELYRSLFRRADNHMALVEALAEHQAGLTRGQLLKASGLPSGGGTSTALAELEQSGFVEKYADFTRPANGAYYRLLDPFTRFHLRFVRSNRSRDEHYWSNTADTGRRADWRGHAFEQVCLSHLPQIKRALGISGVSTAVSAWRSRGTPGAEVDLVIDRRDGIVNLCEMQFAGSEFRLDKATSEALQRKAAVFAAETGTRKAVHTTLVTPYGLAPGSYRSTIQSEVTLDDLFA
jgi:AAA+ ATPase superfamily predicted ATPase